MAKQQRWSVGCCHASVNFGNFLIGIHLSFNLHKVAILAQQVEELTKMTDGRIRHDG
jgi:hypothetical protein